MNKPDVIRQPLGVIIATFAVIISLVVIRVATVPYAVETSLSSDMPPGRFIDGLFPSDSACFIVGVFIALLSATLLTGMIVRYSVSVVRTYLPMIIYTMTAYGIFFPLGSVSANLIPLLVIVSGIQMISGFKRSYQFSHVFKSAFFAGIIPMFYAPAIILTLIVPVTLSLYRRTAREWIVAWAGLFLPLIICSIIWWGAGEPFTYIAGQLYSGFLSAPETPALVDIIPGTGLLTKAYFSIYTALLLYSIIVTVRRLASLRPRARKIYTHFIWLLVLCLVMVFIAGGNIISLALLAVPGCVIISTFFIRHSGWIPLSIYLTLVLLVIAINLLPLLG